MSSRGITGRRRPRTAAIGLLAVVAAAAGVAQASAQELLTCFGQEATIVGAGAITGTPDSDVIVGSPDDDFIDGLGGNDRICSLDGADIVRGGLGNDMLDAGAGDDLVVGDVRTLGATFSAPGGNDAILAGPGDDVVTGDNGVPFGDASGDGGNDAIDGGPGFDFLFGDHNAAVVSGSGGNDTIDTGTADGDPDFLGDHAIGDSMGSQSITGAGGNDTIRGRETTRRLVGDHSSGLGADPTLSGPGGNDVIHGGSGDDAAIVGDHLFSAAPTGASGNDKLFGNEGDDGLHGDSWNPPSGLDHGDGKDHCAGGSGTDTAANCEEVSGIP